MEIKIKDMGAVSDGKTKNTVIIQQAIDMCAVSGGKVVISEGVYLPYRIRKSENIRIFNEKMPISTDVGREETQIDNILFDTIIMSGIYGKPIMIEIDPNDDVLCKCIDNIRFSNVHAIALQYPHFKGRPRTPLGDIYFYNCSFTRKDEIDGEKSPRAEMIQEYADKMHFINTEFHES